MTDYKGKRVLVLGMARSGLAAADLLLSLQAVPILCDRKTDIAGVSELAAKGCVSRLGEAPEGLLADCDLLLISPGIPIDAPVVKKARELGVPVTGELEFASALFQGKKIAITGTNGKTTTTMLTEEILKNAGKNVWAVGNIGTPVSSVVRGSTPEDYAVIEVSSFQMETADTFHPQVAALLNLTCDHLSRHGTMEVYGALKEKIAAHQSGDDFLAYNADDGFCAAAAQRAPAGVRPFSRRQILKTGAWLENGQIVLDGKALCSADELQIRGPHNLENALAAAAITGGIGIPAAVIRHTLRHFVAAEHRMEKVRVKDGILWINDSKGTNPDSTIRAVEGMTGPTVLIAGGEDKKTPFAPLAEAIVNNPNIIRVVLIGKTAGQIREALAEKGYTSVEDAGRDLEKAVRLSESLLPSGGTVLFSPACSSFDMFEDYEDRGRKFKALVNAL